MVSILTLVLVISSTLLGAGGALFFKKGVGSIRKMFTSGYLWYGLFLYGLSVILYVAALRFEELTVVYPLVSLTYIWTIIFAAKYLNEKITSTKIIAVSGIIVGVLFITLAG